ncbi:MAG: GGDEF domain-containing protein [Acidimicrobiales bacterium]|nr:GGDEF domain-containing protein [Acidimicrobiales bacterium]
MGAPHADEPSSPTPQLDPRALLEAVPGAMVLIDAEGSVRWVNRAMEAMSGYAEHELLGTNMLDHVDLTWNPLALESIGYAMDTPGERLPTMLRFRDARGGLLVMEVTANNQFDVPGVEGMVVHLRPADERHLLDQILESFVAGEDLVTTMACVHAVAASDTLRADAAVVLLRPGAGGPSVLASSPEVEALITLGGAEAPWSLAAAEEVPMLLDGLEALPTRIAAAAADQGYEACWSHPVSRPGTDYVDAVLVFWRRERGAPEPNATMMAGRLVSLCEMILERVEHSRQMAFAATHDVLTGLPNRARFFEAVDEHLTVSTGPIGVLYLDLDGFKPVNDEHGHGYGDRVLEEVAVRLRASVRVGDTVARLGGDEFAIACPGASEADLVALAERVLAVVRAPITAEDRVLRVGTTVGIARGERASSSTDVLVAAADAALLEAKASAKGTWRLAPR